LVKEVNNLATFISPYSIPTPFKNEDNIRPRPHSFFFSRKEKIKKGKKLLPHSSHLSTITPFQSMYI